MIDYKILTITDTGKGVNVLIRVFSGKNSNYTENNHITGVPEVKSLYRRTGVLGEKVISLKAGVTDKEIATQLNIELGKFPGIPITVQRA